MFGAEVRGLEDLRRVSRALRQAGDQGKGLRRELYASLNSATKEVRSDLAQSIAPALPSSGGLAQEVARTTKFSTSTTGGGRNVGVRIRGRGRHNIRRMNAGSFRHPVFGNRERWVTQTAGVRKGFLDEAFEKDKPKVRDAVLEAIAKVARQIYRSI